MVHDRYWWESERDADIAKAALGGIGRPGPQGFR
jgi:hypothetical protein